MTKWKKEIKRHGFKLQNDYPMIPFDLGSQIVLGVYVNILHDGLQILTEYNSLVSEAVIDRSGKVNYEIL